MQAVLLPEISTFQITLYQNQNQDDNNEYKLGSILDNLVNINFDSARKLNSTNNKNAVKYFLNLENHLKYVHENRGIDSEDSDHDLETDEGFNSKRSSVANSFSASKTKSKYGHIIEDEKLCFSDNCKLFICKFEIKKRHIVEEKKFFTKSQIYEIKDKIHKNESSTGKSLKSPGKMLRRLTAFGNSNLGSRKSTLGNINLNLKSSRASLAETSSSSMWSENKTSQGRTSLMSLNEIPGINLQPIRDRSGSVASAHQSQFIHENFHTYKDFKFPNKEKSLFKKAFSFVKKHKTDKKKEVEEGSHLVDPTKKNVMPEKEPYDHFCDYQNKLFYRMEEDEMRNKQVRNVGNISNVVIYFGNREIGMETDSFYLNFETAMSGSFLRRLPTDKSIGSGSFIKPFDPLIDPDDLPDRPITPSESEDELFDSSDDSIDSNYSKATSRRTSLVEGLPDKSGSLSLNKKKRKKSFTRKVVDKVTGAVKTVVRRASGSRKERSTTSSLSKLEEESIASAFPSNISLPVSEVEIDTIGKLQKTKQLSFSRSNLNRKSLASKKLTVAEAIERDPNLKIQSNLGKSFKSYLLVVVLKRLTEVNPRLIDIRRGGNFQPQFLLFDQNGNLVMSLPLKEPKERYKGERSLASAMITVVICTF